VPVGAGLTVAVNVTVAPVAAGFDDAIRVVVVVVVVVGAVIVSVYTLEVEPAKPESPEYTAVSPSAPAGNVVVDNVATPDELTSPLPRSVSP
jgi:hypothetical protein